MPESPESEHARVLFDGNWWVEGPISNRSVQREFILAWSRSFPDDEIILAVPRAHVKLAQRELGGSMEVVGTRLSPHGVSALIELPVIARRHRVDVTITHNFTPLFGAAAVFIHDFLFLSDPDWFTRKERLYFSLMRMSLGRADAVFASTLSEARRIARFSRRSVAPQAVGMGLSPAVDGDSVQVPGLTSGEFILTVGRLNARKNLVATTTAALQSGSISPEFPLVVVGEASGKGAELPRSVSSAVSSGAIIFLGRVDDAALRWLYRNTALFLFLSLDEGFGMPTLEALHAGAPLLVSDIPVFREILGSNAAFVDPQRVDAIAGAIVGALASPPPAPGRFDVLRRYSWEGSVSLMRTALRSLLSGGGAQ